MQEWKVGINLNHNEVVCVCVWGVVVNGFFFNSYQHILNRPRPFLKEGIDAVQVWLPRRPHLFILREPVALASI